MPMLRSYGGNRSTGRPPSRISPRVGRSKPASMFSVVVLPEPDGPSSVRNSPCATSSVSPRTASVRPS